MDDYNDLEEPPPFERAEPITESRRKSGLQAGLSGRSSKPPSPKPPSPKEPPGDRDYVEGAGAGKAVALSVAALVALSVPVWLYLGVRSDLADLRSSLDEANSSLRQVGELAKALDQDRMQRLALLGDSIRLVFDYAQGEVQEWQQRLEETDRVVSMRLDEFAGADRAQRSRMDALERQNRTYSSAFEALVRRAQTQESTTYNVSASVSSLRTTLAKLDAELAALEQRHGASTTAFAQLGRRMDSFSIWADGFRQAGLSGEAVQGRFSALSDELRRIRIRVDSLRPVGRATTTSDPR